MEWHEDASMRGGKYYNYDKNGVLVEIVERNSSFWGDSETSWVRRTEGNGHNVWVERKGHDYRDLRQTGRTANEVKVSANGSYYSLS